MLKKEFIPGWTLLVGIALISSWASGLLVIGGKQPLEASAIAVILGVIIRNAGTLPKQLLPGIASAEKLLIFGVVLLGAGLDFNSLAQHGPSLLTVIIGTMVAGFFVIYWLGRAFRLPESLSLLLAVGTTICGTSAIAITAPLIKAKDSETSYAIGTVALWGLVAILLYPKLGQLAGVSDFTFGVFAGTAIHSTPQVVGAGYIFSDLAGQTATAVKLVRNCFMAPLAIFIAVWVARRSGQHQEKVNIARAFPWFLFAYFLMAGLSTKGFFTKVGIDGFTEAGKFLVLLGMAGVGLSTVLSAFKEVGSKPLLVGLIGTALLAAFSAGAISLLLPGA